MSRLTSQTLLVSTLLAATLAMASPSAVAATQARAFVQNGTGACQPALPVYAGIIRARPLAIQNEATSAAYLNCSLQGTQYSPVGARSITDVFVGLINNTGADVSVTCSTIDGLAKITSSYISSKTISVPTGYWAELHWTAADNNSQNWLFSANVQCLLPPGIGVSYVSSLYSEDVGA